MKITFKLYATLMAYLPEGTPGHALKLEIDESTTVQQIIDRFGIAQHMAFLVMLNGIYIAPEDRLKTVLAEHDVLAIWPKVAGG